MNDEAIKDFCLKTGIELLIQFGSTAKGTQREGSDIDLAIKMKRGSIVRKLDLIHYLGGIFEDREIDLVIMSLDTDAVLLYEIFSMGRPLYEARPGIFDKERLRAFKLYYDTEKLRMLRADYLMKFAERNRIVA
jgi:predicted nucleotidyltransferase